MAWLVLINGAPGSGKSTIACRLAQDRPLDLALDVDAIKFSLGQWERDPTEAGYHARRLALALAEAQLRAGHNVYLGQFLAKVDFIEQLENVARESEAAFIEIILDVDADELRHRLEYRAATPERPQDRYNAALIDLESLPSLVRAIEEIALLRPRATTIDGSGELDTVAQRVRRCITACG